MLFKADMVSRILETGDCDALFLLHASISPQTGADEKCPDVTLLSQAGAVKSASLRAGAGQSLPRPSRRRPGPLRAMRASIDSGRGATRMTKTNASRPEA